MASERANRAAGGWRGGFPWALFAGLMALDVGAQVVEKLASVRAEGQGIGLVLSYLRQPWVWVVLGIKVGQLFVWTAILRRVEISLAFPLTALAYPLTMGASVLVFHEQLSWQIWMGGLLITAGAIVMGAAPGEGMGEGAEKEARP